MGRGDRRRLNLEVGQGLLQPRDVNLTAPLRKHFGRKQTRKATPATPAIPPWTLSVPPKTQPVRRSLLPFAVRASRDPSSYPWARMGFRPTYIQG